LTGAVHRVARQLRFELPVSDMVELRFP
jgi:hypothetical protein